MKKPTSRFIIPALTLAAGIATSCGTSDSQMQEYAGNLLNSSTMITNFNLKDNAKVLDNLSNVFFTIDQTGAEIFNADSLPWGTDVRKIVTNITTQGEATVRIIMPSLTDGSQTTVEVSDSVNFTGSNGVMLRVTSADGSRERVYRCKVNVHRCNPDSLQWSMTPTTLPCPGAIAQQTIEMGSRYYCVSKKPSGKFTVATSADAEARPWSETAIELPEDADVNSLAATADALFIHTASGSVMTSVDGLAWSEIASGWDHLYGAWSNQIVGVKNGRWIAYPSGNEGALPAGMPVSGTSRMWTFSNDWALSPQAMFVGGRDADGNISADAWGFDGQMWMRLSGYLGARQLPRAENMALIPYFTFRVNSSNYLITKQSAWLAFGGRLADGKLNKTVYISLDNGVNWLEGSESIQLPKAFEARTMPSVLLINKTETASRAIKPITQWDAPYIHIIGGYDELNTLYNQSWVGVINRLTFKPLQ